MRKITFLFSLFLGLFMQAQILDYNDLGILLSTENTQGTARTMALKNAFGALGGDLSAIRINPAGAAVYNYSTASFSLGNSRATTLADFYGTRTSRKNKQVSLSQIGGLLLFNKASYDASSNWKKVSVSATMNTIHNFNNTWIAKGLTQPTWTVNADESIQYTRVDSQKYSNITKGSLTSANFTMAAQYGKTLFIGASFNSYDVEYTEDSKREEVSSDGLGNSVDAFESFWQEVNGDAYSFSAGFIIKPTQNIRLGLSYTSPVWYELTEESNMFTEDEDDFIGYYNIIYSDEENAYFNSIDKVQTFNYELKTPSKTTASIAFVLGKRGLISADFSTKNYKGIRLGSGTVFEVENNYFKEHLKNTYQFNLGTEWRFKKLSLRGGYSYEQTPYVDFIETDNIRGYALGLGYDFGNFIVDVAYDYRENTDHFNFYPDVAGVSGAELYKSNSKLLATLAFKF